MKLFPPSPKNYPAALRYVKQLPRRRGISDYRAVREAALGPFSVAPMFFVFAALLSDDFTIFSMLGSFACGLFGVFCFVLGHRAFQLLDLFQNTTLPETDSAEVAADANKKNTVNPPELKR